MTSFDDAIRAIVREEVNRVLAERDTKPEIYSSAKPEQLPMSKRRFLEAARAGAFPSSKRGKLITAKRVDVEAWLAGGERMPAAPKPKSKVERILAEMKGGRR